MYPTTDIGLRPTIAPSTDNVMAALRRAADETGTDFGYLLNTAMRESSLNPKAKAATSSATGLFQFIEQTWLGTVKRYGAEHGLSAYADAIKVGKDGRYSVADAATRQEILALRKDATTASLMAGELTNQVRGDMETALGRGVSAGELYVAHFLGPQAAIKLIKAAEATPSAPAADMFPQAAAANRSIFYKGGAARSASAVLASLTAKHGSEPAGDMMMAAAETPVREWRGAINEVEPASKPIPMAATGGATINRMIEHVTVMAPVMVQLMAALDMPSLFDEEPQLRLVAGGVI